MTTGRADDAGPDHGGVVPFPRRGGDALSATGWPAPPWLRAPTATGGRATLLAVRPVLRVGHQPVSGRGPTTDVPAPAQLDEPATGLHGAAPAPADDRPRTSPRGAEAAPVTAPRTVAEAAALRWPSSVPRRAEEGPDPAGPSRPAAAGDRPRTPDPAADARPGPTAGDGPSVTAPTTTGPTTTGPTTTTDDDDDDATTDDDHPAPPVRHRPTDLPQPARAAVDRIPHPARQDSSAPRPREAEPAPVPPLPHPRPAPDHRPSHVLVPGRGGLGPARPRVVEEPGILGLSRLTRGRVGSRLFTLFFVAVFALIFVQMLVTLVHG